MEVPLTIGSQVEPIDPGGNPLHPCGPRCSSIWRRAGRRVRPILAGEAALVEALSRAHRRGRGTGRPNDGTDSRRDALGIRRRAIRIGQRRGRVRASQSRPGLPVTDRRKPRCTCRMPPDSSVCMPGKHISVDTLIAVIEVVAGLGIGSNRLTGDELLTRPDVVGIVARTNHL